MSTTRIKYLISLFYEGTLSAEEEKELYVYFLQEDTPAEFENDKKIFISLYHADEEIPVPTDLNRKLENLIDNLNRKEKVKRSKYLFRAISGVAASIALLLSLGWYFTKEDSEQNKIVLTDTYSNPEDAYEETKKTLLLVSAKLNSGITQLDQTEKKLNKVINKKIRHE